MRLAVFIVLLAACATAPAAAVTPPERVRGCWIERGADGVTTTMRWLPDASRPGVLEGHLLEYRPEANRTARYSLEPRDGGHFFMCSHWRYDDQTCWKVAQGEEGSLEGGRVFIDASDEGLRIAVVSDGLEDVIFEGRRDGCD